MEENTQTAQLALEELKNQFECYRKNKSYNREPIPKQLWQAAADLAKKHLISTVSKTLGLRYASLKEQIYGPPISKSKLKEKPPSFIEIKHSQLLSEMPVTVDVENKRGARMRICLKEADITSLIKSFLSL